MFDFKLQKVLDYRENIERKSKEEFAQKLLSYNRTRDRLESILRKKEEMKTGICEFKTANEYLIYQRYMEYLSKKIEEEKELLLKIESEMQKARLELIKSTKDKKVIEILKESAFEEYIEDENRLEQKNLDDIALRAYIDRLKGGEN